MLGKTRESVTIEQLMKMAEVSQTTSEVIRSKMGSTGANIKNKKPKKSRGEVIEKATSERDITNKQ